MVAGRAIAGVGFVAILGLLFLASKASAASKTPELTDMPLPSQRLPNDGPLYPGSYFTGYEVRRSQKAAELGDPNIPDSGAMALAVRLAREIGDPFRRYLGKPVIITSWFRNENVNREVGGVSNSKHMTGAAFDIKVQGMTSTQIARALLDSGIEYGQIIGYAYKGHLHVSLPGYGTHGVLWSPRKNVYDPWNPR